MRRASSRSNASRPSGDHWLSFSDLMSALLLVFVLIMFYSVYQYLDMLEIKTAELARQSGLLDQKEEQLTIKNEELETSKAKLDESEKELIANQAKLLLFEKQLNSSQELLTQQRTELDSQSALLQSQQKQLSDAQSALSLQQSQLLEAQALLGEKEDYIASQQSTLSEQEKTLAAQRLQMQSQQTALDAIVGVKSLIISDLAQKLQDANIRASVDAQTGSITLDASVLFDVGKSVLKDSGKRILDRFLPVYLSVVMDGEYADSVSEIIIEGHTDTDGTYMANLALSQQRALSVMQYILNDDYTGITPAMKKRLRTVATANGRSFSNPVYTSAGTVDKPASRRVEFKFRLQDEQMIQSMREILEGMD